MQLLIKVLKGGECQLEVNKILLMRFERKNNDGMIILGG